MADGRRALGGVRVRASVAATLVVAVVLAAAAVTFVVLQRHQLEASLTEVARQEASDASARVLREGSAIDLRGGGGDQSVIQVLDGRSVVAASPSIDGEPALVDLTPAPGDVRVVTSGSLPIGEGEMFVVVAEGVSTPDRELVVIAAQSLETVQESTAVVGRLLLIGYPLVLLAVALTSYWLTGRALAPVEEIRRRVATIDGTSSLSARVPVPSGDEEIARLATTMNSMLARLQAGAESQQRFVGDASHELRSPLATIRAAHEIHSLHPGTTGWPSVSTEVLAELDRVDRLVSDLLLLARSDEHGLALHTRDVDLDDLVRSEADRLRRSAQLEVVVSAPPVRVIGDPHHLARALRNLTENAARYAGHRVELRLSTSAGSARIDVLDDGPGLSSSDQERIFERFVRLDEARARDSGGTGLGLPIARQIARAHDGDVVAREAAVGGHFTLTVARNMHPVSGA